MGRPQEFDTQLAIDAAMAVFWERGLHRTSIDDILAASGIARSSLYNSFGGKQELFEAAVERYVEIQVGGLQRMLESTSLEKGLEKLFYNAASNNHDGRGCLLANCTGGVMQRDVDEQPILRSAFGRMFAVVEARIRRAQQENEISDSIRPADAAMLVCATLSGFNIFHKAGIQKSKLKRAADLAVKMLLQQIA
jgi:TetR/AcrR family transcriptional repressor of nem operon